MDQPRISVVVPCYNAAAFIGGTLDSILGQDPPPLEVLVVDDGSTDGTTEVLDRYGDRIRRLAIPNSGTPSRPRNVGVSAAAGELVAFCDADDVMLPGKIAAVLRAFAVRPDIDFLFTNFEGCDEDGVTTVPDYLAEYREFRGRLADTAEPGLKILEGADAYRSLLRANFVGTSSVVCRTRVLAAAGGFDEGMRNSEDLDLWRRIARGGARFAFLDRVLHRYRQRPGSVSRGGSCMYPAWITGMERQLEHCRVPEDLAFVKDRIRGLWLGYGYALRREGRLKEARAAYRESLARGLSWTAVRGLARTMLESLAGRTATR